MVVAGAMIAPLIAAVSTPFELVKVQQQARGTHPHLRSASLRSVIAPAAQRLVGLSLPACRAAGSKASAAKVCVSGLLLPSAERAPARRWIAPPAPHPPTAEARHRRQHKSCARTASGAAPALPACCFATGCSATY